ncbi:hypothetical protein CORC01_02798 [Colletotrichum orchidophilum]|uniref:Glc8 protein n=1 Tax=Colletotrichum orchidophilum TaxID=1209926 RepID=A0A1G4BKB2_9PEZI|nr:uncharacterized protein CORC01_02798 [Colletotrichum orchidophilum]OHF01920.1 hypothetical protein CORC01_02798 [Colletotrichum orchidophilum]
MAAIVERSPPTHSPPGPHPKRPRGILKNSYQKSPPTSPGEADLTEKELTLVNTQYNAGHRRSSSAARPSGSRRQSSRTPSQQGDEEQDLESSQRLKWDEANLYLTEQERTSTMKIDEPKTPYAKHYDPTEDPSDDEEMSEDPNIERKPRTARAGPGVEDDIPIMSLGEPEEAVPESESSKEKALKAVHVDDSASAHGDDDELAGLSPEEREKHRRFEELRKKHYEMKDVAHLLGHPEELAEEEEDDEDRAARPPPVPALPRPSEATNGQA